MNHHASRRLLTFASLASTALAQGPVADPLPDVPFGNSTVRLTDQVSNLVFPVDVADPGDGSGRLFVTQVDGLVRIVRGGVLEPTPFADLRQTPAFGNNGSAMSSIVFHPDFAADEQAGLGGRLFVVWVEAPQTGTADFGIPIGAIHQSVLYELRADPANPDVELVSARRELLRVNEQWTIHNLDDLAFGIDGYLYVSKGDDLSGGQDPLTIAGSILRIDVDFAPGNALSANGQYAIPADNPFVGDARGRDEIFAYGFRNPWRIAIDSATGELWCADIGEHHIEEVDRVTLKPDGSARNFGWDEMEGTFRYLDPGITDDLSGLPPGFDGTAPVAQYDHDELDLSITGGVLYRGALMPHLVGHYICSDWISGHLFAVDPSDGSIERIAVEPTGDTIHGQPPYAFGTPAEGVIAVREDAQGELLLVVAQRNTTATGRILRVEGGDCAMSTRCTAAPNSTGQGSTIAGIGSASLAANDLVLRASSMPPQQPGVFFYGTSEIEVPFGDGLRCVGGTVTRVLPIGQSNGNGTLHKTFDSSVPPHAQIGPGSSWNFQAWYRDPAAAGTGFNLSNALRVTFCP